MKDQVYCVAKCFVCVCVLQKSTVEKQVTVHVYENSVDSCHFIKTEKKKTLVIHEGQLVALNVFNLYFRIWTPSQSSQSFCHDTADGLELKKQKKNISATLLKQPPLLFSLCGFCSQCAYVCAYFSSDCKPESIHIGRYVLFMTSRKTWTAQISSFGDLYSSHLYSSAVGFPANIWVYPDVFTKNMYLHWSVVLDIL